MKLKIHPSAQILALDWRVSELLRAVEEERPWKPAERGAVKVLVWRRNARVFYRDLERAEADALEAASRGATFAEICDIVAGRCAATVRGSRRCDESNARAMALRRPVSIARMIFGPPAAIRNIERAMRLNSWRQIPKSTGDTISIERPTSREQLESSRGFRSRFTAGATRGGRPTCRTRSICCRAAACSRRISKSRRSARAARGRLVARVSAVINRRYIEHWNEQLGQLIQFEALEGEDVAVAAMLDEAVQLLRERGMRAVRSGFAAFLDYPYAIDNYDSLPSFLLRGNPASYHRYFKEAGFVTEKGQVDYTARAHARNPRALSPDGRGGAPSAGVTIQSWREYGFLAAIDAWTDVTNAAFDRHWGWNPVTRAEVRPMLTSLWETPVADLSMLATIDGECVGAVFSVPDLSPALPASAAASGSIPSAAAARAAR